MSSNKARHKKQSKMRTLNIKNIENQIINAKNDIELEKIIENIPRQQNGEKFQIARILDDAFWYIDLTTFESKQKFMLKRLK